MPTDKNGKKIKIGNILGYDNYLGTVVAVDKTRLEMLLRPYESVVVRIPQSRIKDVEVLTEEEVTIFLLKSCANR